ncbi:MAG: aminopeptidase P family N-terminal domain-containing protein, partial [Planctomycetaceae bacterium]|nr:aminopeptidase P family N-terminal domain-containing protein [Planctomycetaceae bacterium]
MILPKREFEERIHHTQQLLKDSPLDAVLAFSTESEPAGVRYYSDYWPSFETAAILIPRHGDAALLIGPESLRYARSRSKLERIIQVMDFRESSQPAYPGSVLPTWKDVLDEFQVKILGIAGWHMFPYPIMLAIMEALGANDQVVNADELIRKVTMKKSVAEIECLREAARISEVGLKAVLEKIR